MPIMHEQSYNIKSTDDGWTFEKVIVDTANKKVRHLWSKPDTSGDEPDPELAASQEKPAANRKKPASTRKKAMKDSRRKQPAATRKKPPYPLLLQA